MPNNTWPTDALGNEIREGNLIHFKLASGALFFRVTKVQPAGVLAGPDGQPMSLQGSLTLHATMEVTYNPRAAIVDAVVVKEPEPPTGVTQ